MQMHGHFKTETNNTSCKGNTALWQLPTRKIRKFIKSKFKILTCVVLLGRLNTMRGISAGKYDKGNKSIMMRGIWVGEIYIWLSNIYLLSQPGINPVILSQNHNQLLQHLLFAFNIFFDQIFVHFCFVGGFSRRCSYDQAVLSKFMPRISLYCRHYDITASWQKKHSTVFKSSPIHSKITV